MPIRLRVPEDPVLYFTHEGKASINSAHRYQVFAYLQNLGAKDHRPVDGLLLNAQA